ncbi:MAG: DNA repair protein RecN [Nitriliruptoraceae bacterium]
MTIGTIEVIEELHIRGLGVIEEASLRLSPGLTVVTGETGAGKTMLVTALELLLGARSDANLVRSGTTGAFVEAVIDPAPPEAGPWLDDPADPLIVSREIPAEGRSRARVSGRLVPASTLSEIIGRHVEVHAQHEHVRLATAEVQRELLDRYAGDGHQANRQRYTACYSLWRELTDRRRQLVTDATARERELDRLRFEAAEIESAGIDPSSDDGIDRQISILAHADDVLQGAALASNALGSDGAAEPLGTAIEALRRIDVEDPVLDDLRGRLEGLASEVSELSSEVRAYGDQVEADPRRLAELQERRHLLATLRRKYGADLSEVLAHAEVARHRIEELETAEADAGDLDARIAAARSDIDELVGKLRAGRQAAAALLEGVVDSHLDDLGMPHARFHISVEPLPDEGLTADGGDRVTYLLAANPGEPPRPLARASSGGERSRVSLAIEVALADVDDARVLVFDEVDAGIGGATAMAVGDKLAQLAGSDAGGRQVLCVTHLAQLAAFADVHHVVEKSVVDGRTVTTSRQVGEESRVGELARMLGGDAQAQAGRDHARELLSQARPERGV